MWKHGTSSNGKDVIVASIPDCPWNLQSKYIDYPGRNREVKQQIVEMTLNGSEGERYRPRVACQHSYSHQEIKKNSPIAMRQSVAVEPTPTLTKIGQWLSRPKWTDELGRSELDEMWSYVGKKTNLDGWHTIDRKTGKYWLMSLEREKRWDFSFNLRHY